MNLVLYYKCLNNLVALPGSEYFQYNSQTRTGGNRLTRPGCSTNRFQTDFFNRCLPCWNRYGVTCSRYWRQFDVCLQATFSAG